VPFLFRSPDLESKRLSEKALRRAMRKTSPFPMDADPYTRLCHRLLGELKSVKLEAILSIKGEIQWLDEVWSEAHELLMASTREPNLEYWYEVYPKLVELEKQFASTALENTIPVARPAIKLELAHRAKLFRALATLRSNTTPTHMLVEELPGDYLEYHLKLSFAEVDRARKLRDDFFYSGKLDSVHAFFELVRNAADAVDEKHEELEEYLERVDVALLMLEIDG